MTADASRQLVLFELNELPRAVLDDYCRRRPESSLARLTRGSLCFETRSEDEGPLSPWITWPTLHRGVTNAVHGISHLGQALGAADQRCPPIWERLAAAGLRVGVGASLHADPGATDPGRFAFFLPDAFANESRCEPPSLEVFQAFNQAMVDGAGRNVSRSVALREAARLLAHWRSLGLSGGLALRLLGQLFSERIHPERAVRRRSLQGLLSFEVVAHQIERCRPDFATCFTNHVAAAMHRYWAAAWPEQFEELSLPSDWIARYRGEIDFAMNCADLMAGRLLRIAASRPELSLVVASSMGQAAYHHTVPVTTELRVVEPEVLMASLGFARESWRRRRAMEPQFHVAVAPERADELEGRLATLKVNGYAVGCESPGGGLFNIIFANRNLDDDSTALELEGRSRSAAELGLANVAVQDAVGSTGYHVPEGLLMLYRVPHECVPWSRGEAVPTHEIAPFLLRFFGV